MRAYARSIDPATGVTVAEYPMIGQDALEQKLAAASTGFDAWRHAPLEVRCTALMRMAALLEQGLQDFTEMIVGEVGKTIGSAEAEIKKCAYTLRFYAEHASRLLVDDEASVPGFSTATVKYLPLGPVLAIMPWN